MTAPDDLIATALPVAIDLRHRLHQVPEYGYHERKTADLIRGETDGIWGDDRPKFDALRFPPPTRHWSQHALTIPPTLVIESVSVGHEAHDRRTKRRWYADFGIGHHWIVDGLRRTLDCLWLDGDDYRDDGSGREGEVVRPPSLAGLDLPLADVWVR